MVIPKPSFLMVFPSPDGELVGLDLNLYINGSFERKPQFPSPDGELVGLDLKKKEQEEEENNE